MTLVTQAELPFVSPLASVLRGQETVLLPDAQRTVGLADISGRAITELRTAAMDSIVTDAYGTPAPPVGVAQAIDDGKLVRIRPDILMLVGIAPPSEVAGEPLCTVTDVTHGYGQMVLLGAAAPDVLPKVCGLDFANGAFPNHRAALSSLAKARTLVIRMDIDNTPAYHLLVDYTLASYVWSVVFDAMAEFDGVVASLG